MKSKKPDGNGDVPQFELNKRLTIARTNETRAREQTQRTREKMHRLHLAKERDDLVEKKVVTNRAAFLFTAMRQKMLAVLLAWHRRLMGVVLQVWNSNAGGCDNGMNQTSIPNIPTIKRWSRPTFAPQHA